MMNQYIDYIYLFNHRFAASRFVLSISSTYFEKMFTGYLRESMQKEIVLHGISGVVLEKVLPVFYTGNTN